MLLNIVLISLLSFSSCTIEGEEICGIWNAKGDYGSMQIEITPWEGKFLGYLLEYKGGDETITGSKTEDFIFITDLKFKDNKYQGGKIYLDPNSETSCGLTLERLNENQVKAIYDCEGQTSEEIWYRKGTIIPEETLEVSSTVHAENKSEKVASKKVVSQPNNEVSAKADKTKTRLKATPPAKTKKSSTPQIEGETKKQSTFYIIGIQEVIKYDDFKAMEKAIEALWAKSYNEDFSEKLKNIDDQNSMYVSYSGYDKPKGKMTITLGYKVKDLKTAPSGLKGVKIPSNEYLVYPMSGEKSDFEGDGWEQLGELMMYRKADSADFEIYTFDNSYNVKKAEMWIATK